MSAFHETFRGKIYETYEEIGFIHFHLTIVLYIITS